MKIKALGPFSCLFAVANARALVGRQASTPSYDVTDVLNVLSDPTLVPTPEPFCSSILGYKPATTTVTTTTTGTATSVTYVTVTITLSTKTVELGTVTSTDTYVPTATNARTTLTISVYITTPAAKLFKRVVTPTPLKSFPATLVTDACSSYITTTSTTTKYAQTKETPVETRTRTQTVRVVTETIAGATETVTSTALASTSYSTVTNTATIRLPAGQAAPTIYPGSDGYTYESCYQDSANSAGRALQGPPSSTAMTPAQCIATCKASGKLYAGLEYGGECWCGDTINNGNGPAPDNECTRLCSADNTALCGNSYRLSVYKRTGESTTPSASGPVPYTDTVAIKPFKYKGCYAEPTTGSRAMKYMWADPAGQMTPQKCFEYCKSRQAFEGCTKFGVEWGIECRYDIVLASGHKKLDSDAQCNKACPGDPTLACGGSMVFSYYSTT
ncbi:hypothetical protein Dda_1598 [Drechslerella dactyloides]|uniref:WSC domain-containing protein n=1 Tax=Drechslerella dactyloides TaxID=74499 RepID=A0AAD6J1Z9_DREDA|nr:hypothetical protein Dda_1598 [Drechslerella dactyloides]